jgi:hypothetical protein
VAVILFCSEPVVVSSRPCPDTETAVTSVTPMVSASAVSTTRPGLRIALRRASEPAEPPSSCAGRPTAPAIVRGEDRAGLRQVQPEGDEHGVEPRGQRHAGRDADERGHQADGQRLGDDRPQDLPALGADHPQQTELARALGDGDRERVQDGEPAHDDRHAAEGQQHDVDDLHEPLEAVEREAVVCRGGLDLRRRGERRPEGLADLRGGHAGASTNEDRVVPALLVQDLLRRAQVVRVCS